MNKINFAVFLCAFSIGSLFSQTDNEIDSLTNVLCKDLNEIGKENLEKILPTLYTSHIAPFLKDKKVNDQDKMIGIIDLRLQRSCDIYNEFVYENTVNNGDWKKLNENLAIEITRRQFKKYFKRKNLIYLEPTGDRVNVRISKKHWIDNFSDGTYSKLKLKILAIGKFEIEFQESNNLMRNSLSNPGDKYSYRVIREEQDYYLMTVEIPGQNQCFSFKMYFNENAIKKKALNVLP